MKYVVILDVEDYFWFVVKVVMSVDLVVEGTIFVYGWFGYYLSKVDGLMFKIFL